MKSFNRLAKREFLIVVAIAASALSLHVRQQTFDTHAQTAHAPREDYGRICEPPAAKVGEARMMPAHCGIRADARRDRPHAPWV